MPQMTIWRMRISCCVTKAANAHSEYVILIAFPLQQWLQERASLLRYMYIAFLITSWSNPHCCIYSTSDYLLTYSMVQIPSWEANWFAASQEIPLILWNPKVHYRTHKRPPPVPILGQPNPVHIPTSHLLEIHPNIIPHLRLGLPSGLFPSGFLTKTLYTPLPSPYMLRARPSHSSRFYNPKNIWWAVQIIQLLIMWFSPLPCYLVPLRPK